MLAADCFLWVYQAKSFIRLHFSALLKSYPDNSTYWIPPALPVPKTEPLQRCQGKYLITPSGFPVIRTITAWDSPMHESKITTGPNPSIPRNRSTNVSMVMIARRTAASTITPATKTMYRMCSFFRNAISLWRMPEWTIAHTIPIATTRENTSIICALSNWRAHRESPTSIIRELVKSNLLYATPPLNKVKTAYAITHKPRTAATNCSILLSPSRVVRVLLIPINKPIKLAAKRPHMCNAAIFSTTATIQSRLSETVQTGIREPSLSQYFLYFFCMHHARDVLCCPDNSVFSHHCEQTNNPIVTNPSRTLQQECNPMLFVCKKIQCPILETKMFLQIVW